MLTKREQRREAKNDIACAALDNNPTLQERARAIMHDATLTAQRKAQLLGNVRGNALQQAFPTKDRLQSAIRRWTS
jgi:hypothetical protein